MDNDNDIAIKNRPFGRRTMVAGAAGLGLATLVGGSLVRAQDTPDAGTPDATTDTGTDADEATLQADREAEAGARYDDFVTRLAGNLSITDTATVDTAIRTTLTDLVEARFEAGEISANDAEAARTAITDSPAPLMGMLRAGRGNGPGGFGERGRGGSGMFGGDAPDDTENANGDDSDATPAASV